MRVFGITNELNKDLAIFMYDFDNVSLEEVLEETKFLSDVFGIDIYVLKSSSMSYHLISFDIMTKKEVSRIQNYVSIPSDYLNIDDVLSLKFNILRLGAKGGKESPKFIKYFGRKGNTHFKSLKHYLVYREMCKIPQLQKEKYAKCINIGKNNLVIYNTHKTEKRREMKKWIG